MFGFIVLYVSFCAVMNDRGGARLTCKESFQTVVDVVPSVIGLGGNSHRQDESHHRRQANARRIASFKTHDHNSSSVFSTTLNKTIDIVSRKVDFLSNYRPPFRGLAIGLLPAMATGDDPEVAPTAQRLGSIAGRPDPYFFSRSRAAT